MSGTGSSPTPPDPGGGGDQSAVASVLSGVADGLKSEPVLLAGFGAAVLIEIAGVALGGAFVLVASLLLAAYVLSVVSVLAYRHWPGRGRSGQPGDGAAADSGNDGGVRDIAVVRSRRVRADGFGGWLGLSRVRVRRSEDVHIGGREQDSAGSAPVMPPVLPVASSPPPPADIVPPDGPAPPPVALSPSESPSPSPSPSQTPAADGSAAGADAPAGPRDPYTPSLTRARDTVLAAVASASGGVRFDVVADSGCGKTALLEEVASRLKDEGRLVLFITASAPQYGAGRRMGEAEREMADYAACRQLVDAIATDVHRAYEPEEGEAALLTPQAGRELETAILGVRDVRPQGPAGPTHLNVNVNVNRSSDVRIGDLAAGQGTAGGSGPLSSRLAEMQRQLTALLDRMARAHPTALLVDDVHAVLGTPAGDWLMAVLRGLSTAVVVHARRQTPGERPSGARRIDLGLLPDDETAEYVRRRLTEAGWRHDAAEACGREIARVTRGHPIGVATCTVLVRDSLPPDSSPQRARELLLGGDAEWGGDGAFEAVRTFVDEHAERTVGRRLALFDLLVVLRRCTPEILTEILGEEEGVGERHASQLYDWLSGCAFVTPFDDDIREGWRLHDYLRENLDRMFRRSRPTQYALTHAAVERYYRARMNFDQALDEESPHAASARYEDADWQRDSHEWLHHAAHLPREDFEGSKRAMIRLFFEAFFWWDAEVPSSYCDQLIAAYQALPEDRDQRWVAWLEQFRTGYVPGRANQIPGRDRERWDQAGQALDTVADYLRLRRGHLPNDPDLRRIYILYCQLQGDVVWFGGDETEDDRLRADAWFRASAEACTDEDELWIANWAVWQQGDLWSGTDPAKARERLTGLEAAIREQEDNELPVWLAETFSDIAWAEGGIRRAFDCLARAALHGHAYHLRQEVYGQYPNRYSASLYRSVQDRLEQRAREALAAGLDHEVAAARARTRYLFARFWRYTDRDPGEGFGIPDGPADSDLGTDLTDFARGSKWLIRHMAGELEKSIEEPLPDPPGAAPPQAGPPDPGRTPAGPPR